MRLCCDGFQQKIFRNATNASYPSAHRFSLTSLCSSRSSKGRGDSSTPRGALERRSFDSPHIMSGVVIRNLALAVVCCDAFFSEKFWRMLTPETQYVEDVLIPT